MLGVGVMEILIGLSAVLGGAVAVGAFMLWDVFISHASEDKDEVAR